MKTVYASAYTLRIDEKEATKRKLILKSIKADDSTILAFPEFSIIVDSLDDRLVKEVKKISSDTGKIIVMGAELEKNKNVALVFTEDGLTIYKKVHLTKTDKKRKYEAGDEIKVLKTRIGRIGLAVCHDINFPEHFRTLSLKGAEIVVAVSAWPIYDMDGFEKLTSVRCRENQVFGVFSNAIGRHGGDVKFGCSRIVSPFGRILCKDVAYWKRISHCKCKLDREMLKAARTKKENYFESRRPELYKI